MFLSCRKKVVGKEYQTCKFVDDTTELAHVLYYYNLGNKLQHNSAAWFLEFLSLCNCYQVLEEGFCRSLPKHLLRLWRSPVQLYQEVLRRLVTRCLVYKKKKLEKM